LLKNACPSGSTSHQCPSRACPTRKKPGVPRSESGRKSSSVGISAASRAECAMTRHAANLPQKEKRLLPLFHPAGQRARTRSATPAALFSSHFGRPHRPEADRGPWGALAGTPSPADLSPASVLDCGGSTPLSPDRPDGPPPRVERAVPARCSPAHPLPRKIAPTPLPRTTNYQLPTTSDTLVTGHWSFTAPAPRCDPAA
jgi:hypothetical protein